MRFTRQTLAAVAPPPGKAYQIVWDEALPGFGLRVNAGGSRQWVVQYRVHGNTKRQTLGRADTLPLEDARRAAKAVLAKVQLGGDPQAEKKEARVRAASTFAHVAECYLRRTKERLRPRSFDEVERHLTRAWAPLNSLPIHKVTRATVAARLGEIADENGRFASNRARASLSALFSWAMGEGLVEQNPVVGTNKATEEVARDHVISEAELRLIWQACRDDDYGRILRLLILTGQRREEVGGMCWAEVDLEAALWTIPKERAKNGIAHEVPLSSPALTILSDVPRRPGRAHVFGEGQGGFQGWSRAKATLDRRIAASGQVVRPWRVHDLRRTAATRMAEAGTLPHVVEAVLNHVSGHKAGVAGIYNRATYAKEKREALERWAGDLQPQTPEPTG
ncbi:MAG TPA: site-specific integrase [Microvirga sp.]|jgi:integrase